MTQPNTQDILAVMSAPALVCTAAGVVESVNEYAADWLETTTTKAAGQLLGEFLRTPGESLTAFLQRSQRSGHACCKGHVYQVANRSRQIAMICHAQQLQGLQVSGHLLLVFSNVVRSGRDNEDVADFLSHTNSVPPAISQCSATKCHLNPSDANETNSLSDVALGLVHEVNQPLTAIAAYAHSCRRWLSAGPAVHPRLLPTVDKIIEQVHITGQMINSLKGLVRGHGDERQVCDLNELVRESLELLALDSRLESCAVESQLEAKPCPVLVSSAQIKIVLLNLLRNALEASLAFHATESRLCVSVSIEEDIWASATINDSGAGITAEAEAQLFQPFETSKPNGLGLGLIISRCLATAHAGQIDYLPGLSHGASFQLRLPLTQAN